MLPTLPTGQVIDGWSEKFFFFDLCRKKKQEKEKKTRFFSSQNICFPSPTLQSERKRTTAETHSGLKGDRGSFVGYLTHKRQDKESYSHFLDNKRATRTSRVKKSLPVRRCTTQRLHHQVKWYTGILPAVQGLRD